MVSLKVKFGSGIIALLLISGAITELSPKQNLINEITLSCLDWSKGKSKKDLVIYVTDKWGSPIQDVNVTIQKNTWLSFKLTNLTGYCEWKKLQKGTYNISLSKYQYQNISEPFYHKKNQLRNYTLFPYDTLPPEFSNVTLNATSPINWTSDLKLKLSCTWMDQDSNISKVIFNIDYKIYLVTDNISNEFYIVLSNFSLGIHFYYWFANDTFDNFNQTPIYSFIIENRTEAQDPTLKQLLPFLLTGQDNELYNLLGILGVIGIFYVPITSAFAIDYLQTKRKILKLKKEVDEIKKMYKKGKYK